MSESESDVNEQVGDTDLVETRRRLEVTLSRTLNGTTDEAEIGGGGTRATGNLLSLLNPFRREKVAISSLSGVFRSNDSFESIQVSIQSRLREETTGFRESALNIRLNDTFERTEELVDDVDQPSLRNPTAYLSPSLSAVGGLSSFRWFLRRDNIRLRKATNASTVTDSKPFEVTPMSNQNDINE